MSDALLITVAPTGAETAKRLTAKAKQLVERLDKGETMEAVAEGTGASVKSVTEIARNQPKDDLAGEVIERIFATPLDKAASVPSGEGRAVFKVTGATAPDFVAGTPTDRNIEKSFRTALSDDVLGQYIADVQKDVGVSVNQSALKRTVGGEE